MSAPRSSSSRSIPAGLRPAWSRRPRPRRCAGGPASAGIAVSARFVRSLIAARQLRPERFGALLAPDTGWSLMLALYAARLEGWTLNEAQLAEAAGTATVRTRLPALEAKGLIERRPDPEEPGETIITLTDEAAAKMRDYLQEAREI